MRTSAPSRDLATSCAPTPTDHSAAIASTDTRKTDNVVTHSTVSQTKPSARRLWLSHISFLWLFLSFLFSYFLIFSLVDVEPENELASLLLVTSIDVRHVHLNGTPINGASRHATVETQVIDRNPNQKFSIHSPCPSCPFSPSSLSSQSSSREN